MNKEANSMKKSKKAKDVNNENFSEQLTKKINKQFGENVLESKNKDDRFPKSGKGV